MINCDNISIFESNRSTLKETSLDKDKHYYMVDSLLEVIDFDKVKENYISGIKLEEIPKSCDAFYKKDDKLFFIEFKNGKVLTFDIRKKIYDSILIFNDIVKCNICDTRKEIEFILVYNEEVNKNNKECKEFPGKKIQESKSFKKISDSFSKLGNKEILKFKLGDFQNYLLKDLHTYTENEFQEKFLNKI